MISPSSRSSSTRILSQRFILFRLSPNSHVAALVDLHMDNIWAATNRTILDVLLTFAR